MYVMPKEGCVIIMVVEFLNIIGAILLILIILIILYFVYKFINGGKYV